MPQHKNKNRYIKSHHKINLFVVPHHKIICLTKEDGMWHGILSREQPFILETHDTKLNIRSERYRDRYT